MMRFGRLAHDPAEVARVPSLAGHAFAASIPPLKLDRSAISFHPGLYHNDVFPVCTAAGLANSAALVAAIAGFGLIIDVGKVIEFFATIAGIDPTDEALTASDGALMTSIIRQQTLAGFDVGTQTPLVGLAGTLPIGNRSLLALAMARLGHAYIGVTIRERDMDARPALWDVVDGRDDGAIIARHAMVLCDYTGLGDADTVRAATWGDWQPVTWGWLAARLDEAYAFVWRQLASAGRHDPAVDPDVLAAQLRAWSLG
jgi:hypothetical protein